MRKGERTAATVPVSLMIINKLFWLQPEFVNGVNWQHAGGKAGVLGSNPN